MNGKRKGIGTKQQQFLNMLGIENILSETACINTKKKLNVQMHATLAKM